MLDSDYILESIANFNDFYAISAKKSLYLLINQSVSHDQFIDFTGDDSKKDGLHFNVIR